MLDKHQAWQLLREADLVCSEREVSRAVERVASEITAKLADANPLVLSVMGGAVVFTGHLLPLLHFPLELDYMHVTRYDGRTRGSEVRWKAGPRTDIRGRTLLVVDDILDEGDTLAAVRERLLADGAEAFFSAVFADKDTGRAKPIQADFVGVRVPNRYVFGFGMDINEYWRNLPAIYAMKS
ncbi:MAG TPA: hypoxanthine-guanine phosphoribosyltransferase [Burkholderiales bacterium]|nr:hypoxanthine-guanine phosphoribosyltransferase [Burkholderiales bacterium]